MVVATTVLAHAGSHPGGDGHGTGALAFIAIAVLVGGWLAVGVAAWLFLRARVDSPEPPDTRGAATRRPHQRTDPPPPDDPEAEASRRPEPPPAYG